MAFGSQQDVERYNEVLERTIGHVKALDSELGRAFTSTSRFRQQQDQARDTAMRLAMSYNGLKAVLAPLYKGFREGAREINAVAKEADRLEASMKRLALTQQLHSRYTQILRADFLKLGADMSAGLGNASKALTGHMSQWKGFFSTTTQQMGNIRASLLDYNRGMFETMRYAQMLGRSDGALSPKFWKDLQNSTTMTRQSFMEWNKQWHQMFIGVPMGTKALVEFRTALEGAFGYDPKVLEEMNRRFIEMSNTLPDIKQRLDAIRNADISPQLKATSGALKETLFVMHTLGADVRQLDAMAKYVIKTDQAARSTLAFEKAVQKRNQSVEKFNLSIGKNAEQQLIKLEKHMEAMTEGVTRMANAMERFTGMTGHLMFWNQMAQGIGNMTGLLQGASDAFSLFRRGAQLPGAGGPMMGSGGPAVTSMMNRAGIAQYGGALTGVATSGRTMAGIGGGHALPVAAGVIGAINVGQGIYGQIQAGRNARAAEAAVGGAEDPWTRLERLRKADLARMKAGGAERTQWAVTGGTAAGAVVGGALGFGPHGALVGGAIGGGITRAGVQMFGPSEEEMKETVDRRHRARFAIEAVRQERAPGDRGGIKMPKLDDVETVGDAMMAVSGALIRDDERRSALTALLKQEQMTVTDAMMEAKKIGDQRLMNDIRMLKVQQAINERQAEHKRTAMALVRHYSEVERMMENVVKLSEQWRQASESTAKSLQDVGVFGSGITGFYQIASEGALEGLNALKQQHAAFLKLKEEMGQGNVSATTITTRFTGVMGDEFTAPLQERSERIAKISVALREQQDLMSAGGTEQQMADATSQAEKFSAELQNELASMRSFIEAEGKARGLSEERIEAAKKLTTEYQNMLDPMTRAAVVAKEMAQIERIRAATASTTEMLAKRAMGSHEGMVSFLEREKELAEAQKGYSESMALGMATSYAWNRRIYDLTVARRQELEKAKGALESQVGSILKVQGVTEALANAGVSQREVYRAMHQDVGAMASIMEKLGKADPSADQAAALQAIMQLYDGIMRKQIGITNAKREELEVTMKVREGFLDVIDELGVGSDLVSQILPDAQRGAMAIMNIGTMMRGEEFGGAMRLGFASRERLAGTEAGQAARYTQRGVVGGGPGGGLETGAIMRYKQVEGRRHGFGLQEQQAGGGELQGLGWMRGTQMDQGPLTPIAEPGGRWRNAPIEQWNRRALGEPGGSVPERRFSYPEWQRPGGRMTVPGRETFQRDIAYAAPGEPGYFSGIKEAQDVAAAATKANTVAINDLTQAIQAAQGVPRGTPASRPQSYASGGSVDMGRGGMIPGAPRNSRDDTFATVRGGGRRSVALVGAGEYVIPANRVNIPGGINFAEGVNQGGDRFLDMYRSQMLAEGGSLRAAASNPVSVTMDEGSYVIKRSSVPRKPENRELLENFVRGYADGGQVENNIPASQTLTRAEIFLLTTQAEKNRLERDAKIRARISGGTEEEARKDYNTALAQQAERRWNMLSRAYRGTKGRNPRQAFAQVNALIRPLHLEKDQIALLQGILEKRMATEKLEREEQLLEQRQERVSNIRDSLQRAYRAWYSAREGQEKQRAYMTYREMLFRNVRPSYRRAFHQGLIREEAQIRQSNVAALTGIGVDVAAHGDIYQAAGLTKRTSGLYRAHLEARLRGDQGQIESTGKAFEHSAIRLMSDRRGNMPDDALETLREAMVENNPDIAALMQKVQATEDQRREDVTRTRRREQNRARLQHELSELQSMPEVGWRHTLSRWGWERDFFRDPEKWEEDARGRQRYSTALREEAKTLGTVGRAVRSGARWTWDLLKEFDQGGPIHLDADRQTAGLRFLEGGAVDAGSVVGLGGGGAIDGGTGEVTVRGGLHIDRLYLGGKLAGTQVSGGENDAFTALERRRRL